MWVYTLEHINVPRQLARSLAQSLFCCSLIGRPLNVSRSLLPLLSSSTYFLFFMIEIYALLLVLFCSFINCAPFVLLYCHIGCVARHRIDALAAEEDDIEQERSVISRVTFQISPFVSIPIQNDLREICDNRTMDSVRRLWFVVGRCNSIC